MKKFILAIATGVCAISAHAEDPKPIDFNVQLKGEVPAQGVFEVKSKGWNSGEEIKLTPPDGWNGSDNVMGSVAWDVKSSYGAVRVTFKPEHGVDAGYGKMPDITDEKSPAMRYFPHFKGEKWGSDVNKAIVVAKAAEAASGKEVKADLKVGMWAGKKENIRPGHAYATTVTAVFETGFEG